MTKKVVHYNQEKFKHIVLGQGAIVFPIDHPDDERVSNTREVFTSRVIKIFPNGDFETLNTMYKPRIVTH